MDFYFEYHDYFKASNIKWNYLEGKLKEEIWLKHSWKETKDKLLDILSIDIHPDVYYEVERNVSKQTKEIFDNKFNHKKAIFNLSLKPHGSIGILILWIILFWPVAVWYYLSRTWE